MSDVENRILRNQVEIMWTLHYLLKHAVPDLVGRAGELDRMRDDLVTATRETRTLVERSGLTTDTGSVT